MSGLDRDVWLKALADALPTTCAHCGGPLYLTWSHQRFCSQPCGVAAWQVDNPDKRKSSDTRWRAASRDKINAAQNTWRASHRDYVNAAQRVSRAAKKDAHLLSYLVDIQNEVDALEASYLSGTLP